MASWNVKSGSSHPNKICMFSEEFLVILISFISGLAAEVGAGVAGDAVGPEVGVQVCLDDAKSDIN